MINKFTHWSLNIATALLCVCLLPALQGCKQAQVGATMHPRPMGEEEDEDMVARKKAYIELIHRASPGTNWRYLEELNATEAYYRLSEKVAGKTTGTYAGGVINAIWHERGNDNMAGRTNGFAYLASTNTLYAAADGGSIWRTPLPAISWTKVSDVAEFNSYALGVIPRSGGGARLFVTPGQKIWRTDNNGASFDTSTGITFPVAWGGNYVYRIIPVNDAAHTIYSVTFGWEPSSWTAQFGLYASTDSGVSFHLLRYFPYHNDNQLSFCSPVNSGTLYALGVTSGGADTLYNITNSVVTIAGSTNAFASADNNVDMKCMVAGGVTHFYALTGGTNIYHSSNMGGKWFLKNTVTGAYILGLSSQHPEDIAWGGVEASRSHDSGATFTVINTWGSYYGAMATKLHADLRNFSYFQYSSGTEFGLVGTDGGAYISNNQLDSVSNITLSGYRVNQMWDHITSPTDTNIIIGGEQDQGLQATNAGGGTGFIHTNQVISGDYGQMRITGNGSTLWPEYPGGNIYLYNSLAAPTYICSWTMSGTQKPNVGWMLATSDYFTSSTQNEILIGGGNITGDSGSYLSRLTLTNSSGWAVTPTQYNYNFRTNSNNAKSGISACAVSKLSNNLMYVAAEDGTFFYSTNAGSSWTKTPSYAGLTGSYLYGATILASADSVDKVYFGGSGYSNPGVYVSRDHGQTFTAMGNGLPPTLVNKLAAYSNDSMIFAATEAGPYVYIRADNYWYSLRDTGTPAVNWRSVEYIPSIRTVRFGTYGRGIWDLVFNKPVSHVAVNPSPVPASEIKIGPNPLKNGMPLTLFTPGNQNVNLNVYNSAGRLMFSRRVDTNSGIYLPDMPTGVYIYDINTGSGSQTGVLAIN